MPLFMLGTICATRAIVDRMQHNIGFRNFVETFLEKYAICDWGDTCEVDQELNEHAVFSWRANRSKICPGYYRR